MNQETVKIRLVISIDTDNTVDTGLTIQEWNAMSAEARYARFESLWWEEACETDDGTCSVVTDGAEGL